MLSIRRWYFRTLLFSNSPSVPLRRFFDEELRQWGFRKRLRRGVSNAVVFRSRGKNYAEQACARLVFALRKPELSQPKQAEIIECAEQRLERFRFDVPVGLNLCSTGSLERMCQLQDSRFSESLAKNLQAHRKPLSRLPAWHRNARNSGERSCNRIDISEIHG
jgi:hypothetical protein